MRDLAELEQAIQTYATLANENWLQNGLFTWTWWFLVGSVIVPWILFAKLYDRKRALSIWLFGLTVILITAYTDDLGSELGIWVYPIPFIPFSLVALPFDFSIVPVAQMLIYQYFTSWRAFLLALTGQAAVFAFIGEPFSVWAGAVAYDGWTYVHSFLFYLVTGSLSRVFTQHCISVSNKEPADV
jgi:hypothetical protein